MYLRVKKRSPYPKEIGDLMARVLKTTKN